MFYKIQSFAFAWVAGERISFERRTTSRWREVYKTNNKAVQKTPAIPQEIKVIETGKDKKGFFVKIDTILFKNDRVKHQTRPMQGSYLENIRTLPRFFTEGEGVGLIFVTAFPEIGTYCNDPNHKMNAD